MSVTGEKQLRILCLEIDPEGSRGPPWGAQPVKRETEREINRICVHL